MRSPFVSFQDAPALKAALALAVGILFSQLIGISFLSAWALCLVFSTAGTILFMLNKDTQVASLLLLAALATLGWSRAIQTMNFLPESHIALQRCEGERIVLKGWLLRDPVVKSYRTEYLVAATMLTYQDTTFGVSGKVLVYDASEATAYPGYGDGIVLRGRLERPQRKRNPGGFDLRAYLARSDVHTLMRIDPDDGLHASGTVCGRWFIRNIVYPCRRRCSEILNRVTKAENSALLHALILGDRSSISPEMRDDFSSAGVIHILAVSGLHVGFVTVNLMLLFGLLRFPYPLRVCCTILCLIFFVQLTESRPPVFRAAFMAGLYLTGTLIRRRTNPLNLVGCAGLLLLITHPAHLLEPGFQLSFSGVLSILILLPVLESMPGIDRLRRRLARYRLLNSVFTLLSVSFAAQIGTLPLSLIHFGRFPLLALPMNVLIVPLTAVIVSLGWILLLSGFIHPWLASVYGALADFLLNMLTGIIGLVSGLPFASFDLPPPDLTMVLIYAAVIGMFILGFTSRKRRRKWIALFVILNLFVWKNALDPDLRIVRWVQFDVGQGDAAILHLPRGRHMLIDGGNRTPFNDSGMHIVLPYLRSRGIGCLDGIILTHPHSDHVGGLVSVLENIRVTNLYIAGTDYQSDLYASLLEMAGRRDIPVVRVTAPCMAEDTPGIRLWFLSPSQMQKNHYVRGKENDQSLVILLEFGRNKMLFMGDAEADVETELIKRYPSLRADGLKVGHHGSTSSSGRDFLNQVSPTVAVISVGEKNRFNHPSPVILKRLSQLDCHVMRTDRDGAVVMRCNGSQLVIVDWR